MIPIQKLSVIIPCYKEEGNAKRFEKEVFEFFRPLFPCEFILIDDGSKDSTPSLLQSFQQKYEDVHYLAHENNRGLGEALKTGFKQATGDYILTLDSDLSFHPKEFHKLWEKLEPNMDAVLGSPRLGEFLEVGRLRKMLSVGVNFLYQILLGYPLTSTSSIFRLYRSSSLQSLTLTSRSFDINAEIAVKFLLRGKKITETAVVLSTRVWGESKINITREVFNHCGMFFKIIIWKGKLIFAKDSHG